MKDLHKSARQLWQQFTDAGVSLNSINFQTLAMIKENEVVGHELINVAFVVKSVERKE